MGDAHHDSGETQHERLNRQLDQLLGELRVAMPGVQVLFAFLLAVPFQLVTDVLFDGAIVVVTVVVSAAVFIGLWFVLGTMRRMSKERDGPDNVAHT